MSQAVLETAYGVLGLKGASSVTNPWQGPYTSGVEIWTYFFRNEHVLSRSWNRTLDTTFVIIHWSGFCQLSATMLWAAKLTT